jgi:hypothetical protein
MVPRLETERTWKRSPPPAVRLENDSEADHFCLSLGEGQSPEYKCDPLA